MHLSHLCAATRMPQVDALLDIHARAPGEGGAWCGGHPEPAAGWTEGEMPPMPAEAILLGDFNFTCDSPEYERIVGPLSARYGRLNRLTGFVDAWVAANGEENGGATDRRRSPHRLLLRQREPCAVACAAARVDMSAQGSDHQPLWVDIDL